jgi:hypothetical protein
MSILTRRHQSALLIWGQHHMNVSFRLLAAFFVFGFATVADAGDFVSTVVQANQSLPTITVPGDRFLVIRNFTQEAGETVRGSVSVTTNGLTANNVLTATIVDPAAPQGTLEVINNIVIAGPATVTVNGGDTNCFITYRKGTD